MGIRFIAIAIIIWLGFVLFKKLKKSAHRANQISSNNKMLACRICKTHVPENEAIVHNGKIYCSKDCL